MIFAGLLAVLAGGCWGESTDIDRLDSVWGRAGRSEGRLLLPRAIAIDGNDHVYIVNKQVPARIQVFDTQGQFLRGWHTPEADNGKPTGLAIGRNGNLLVADTHYNRLLIYSPEGKRIQTIGSKGKDPGQFELVLDAVQDSLGNYYVSEMGDFDRVQKFSSEGKFLLQWGGHGSELGQFLQPRGMAIDEDDRIWVADACNHRIQVFDTAGKRVRVWGTEGDAPGELYYPYDLVVAPDGGPVYVCEFGNHRVQKFTREGKSLGCWGSEGREKGQLYSPWGLARDSQGRIHVLDTYNHRVQCVDF